MPIEKMTEVPYPGVVPWLAVRKKINEIIDNGASITVDDALSDSSENPVQNKVINTALGGKADTTDLPDASELVPDTTGASQGDVLMIGADGPEWAPAGGSEKSIIVSYTGSGYFYDGTDYEDLLSLLLAVKDGNMTPGIVIVGKYNRTVTAIPPMVFSGTSGGSIYVPCITAGGAENQSVAISYTTAAGELTSFSINYFATGWMTARIYSGGAAPTGTISKGDLWFNGNTKSLSYYDGTTWQTLFTPSP